MTRDDDYDEFLEEEEEEDEWEEFIADDDDSYDDDDIYIDDDDIDWEFVDTEAPDDDDSGKSVNAPGKEQTGKPGAKKTRNIKTTTMVNEDAERRNIRERLASGRKIHRDILIVTYIFLAVFLGTIVYLGWFSYTQSAAYLANPYNGKRASAFADRYIRGDILSADGEKLATTETADGEEVRTYPYGRKFAHVVGYSQKGLTGLESLCSSYLLSSHINLLEVMKNEVNGDKTVGDSVVTSLDTRLQEKAYELLEDRRGAIIVSEVKTGRILAMVSRPDFNPNSIAENWDEMVSDESNSSLVNRATQGLYPPGSTFKILPLLEYYRETKGNVADFLYECGGIYTLGDYAIKCAKTTEHGTESLKDAFANSCNGAFAVLGQMLDQDKLAELCEDFGYNDELPIDILSNASSYEAPAEGDTWSLLQTSIGQGDTLVTPLQNLLIISAIANDGTAMNFRLLDRVVSAAGETVESFDSSVYKRIISASEAQFLQEYLRAVVTDGSGSGAEVEAVGVAGKTGSAEWKSGEDTHAWFVGYAPYDDPEIAISVIVENAGSGGSVAAPIAREIVEEWCGE